jgi:hypothetical protein
VPAINVLSLCRAKAMTRASGERGAPEHRGLGTRALNHNKVELALYMCITASTYIRNHSYKAEPLQPS